MKEKEDEENDYMCIIDEITDRKINWNTAHHVFQFI